MSARLDRVAESARNIGESVRNIGETVRGAPKALFSRLDLNQRGAFSWGGAAEARPILPEFTGESTSGVLVTNEGGVIPLESGNPSLSNYPAASHVEGKAALELRSSGSSGGTVYHNNPSGTCPYCNSQLPTLLPEGVTLRVAPPDGAIARTRRWIDVVKDYVGNANDPKGL